MTATRSTGKVLIWMGDENVSVVERIEGFKPPTNGTVATTG